VIWFRTPRVGPLVAAVLSLAAVGLALPSAANATLEPVFPSTISPSSTSGVASTYHAVTPFTAYSAKARVAPGHPVTITLAGHHGLPAAGDFDAVAMTVSLSLATKRTAASVAAVGAASPIRTVTASPSRPSSGFTVVPVAASGAVRVKVTGGHARLGVVVEGYQQAGISGATFHPLAAATVLTPHRLGAGATRAVTLVGARRTGLPSNGHIAAVALAVTAATPSATTEVTAYPRGQPANTGEPVVSARGGLGGSGIGIVKVGAHGDVTLRNAHGHATLSAEVEGYWTTDPLGASFQSLTPATLLDATLGAKSWRTVKLASRAGVPPLSQTAAAVLSITASSSSSAAYLAMAPSGRGRPATGPISVPAHSTITSTVVARLNGASVHLYASRRVSLIVRVVGWYGITANGTDVNAGAGSCSSPLLSGVTFAVIRATDGQPFHRADPACFTTETTEAKQLPAAPEYYMNLADPGQASTANWDKGGPRACQVAADYETGCAYDYGYEAAKQAVSFAKGHGMAAGSRWWVDVEIGNSWGSHNLRAPGHAVANVADIHGALRYLSTHGLPAGIYTETLWWDLITGSSTGFSRAPVWGGGADSRANARANCKQVSITGGPALLAQWFTDVQHDHDIAC
jgi:hypothetical protein